MAISFNFSSPSNSTPVKETHNKCINCLHCHKLSKDILRCNITLSFIYVDETKQHCLNRFKEKGEYHRLVNFSFCLLQIVKGTAKYTYTGLGLVVETKLSDNDILEKVRNDKAILSQAAKQINRDNDIAFTPILTFEKYINPQDGCTDWRCISSALNLEESMSCLENLRNRDNNQ